MAGFDEGAGPSLYWCDYLATLHHMNICGTGYGAWCEGWQLHTCWEGRGILSCRVCGALPANRTPLPPSPTLPTEQAPTLCCPCLTSCGTPTSRKRRRWR